MQFALRQGVTEDRLLEFLGLVDKIERMPEVESQRKLAEFGVELQAVRQFIADPSAEAAKLQGILADLKARGLADFVEVDLTIVRGLAYYTGLVFEVFDRGGKERAIAGGGRYDALLEVMSDGKVKMPALGFGMGDVVLANMLQEIPAAKARRDAWLAARRAAEVYVVVAEEALRTEALGLVQSLREAGWRTDYAFGAAKVGKQFQAAETLGAEYAVVVGAEWPMVKVKTLATRDERLLRSEGLSQALRS
jgi:histidyl-tRNA synthetase